MDALLNPRWQWAFTTLACPDWNWEKIIDEALRFGYDGIEVRGIQDEIDLRKVPVFTPANIAATKAALADRGLEICGLGSSARFDSIDSFEQNVEEGKGYIDLAHALGAPYVRVYGDRIVDPDQEDAIKAQIARGLNLLGDYAQQKDVVVLIETHGDFSKTRLLSDVLAQVSSDAVGVLWDMHHPWRFHGEDLRDTYERIAKWIRHIHVKDSKATENGYQYTLTGQGEFPFQAAFALLRDIGYQGWISFEWEKRWHKNIEEPEVALPHFMEYVRENFSPATNA